MQFGLMQFWVSFVTIFRGWGGNIVAALLEKQVDNDFLACSASRPAKKECPRLISRSIAAASLKISEPGPCFLQKVSLTLNNGRHSSIYHRLGPGLLADGLALGCTHRT